MTHLITGGSGFVGSVIAKRLIEKGEKVRVLDIWQNHDLPKEVEFLLGDVTNEADVKKAMQGIKYVHHNAALVPLSKANQRYKEVNLGGTEIVMKVAKENQVAMFSHMSSSAVYGIPDQMPITQQTKRNPIEIYGQSKYDGENIVLAEMAKADGMKCAIVRPRTIIGTERLGIFEILFDWIKDGANIFIIGKGNFPFQFVHVEDLSDVSIRACMMEKPGVYNMGTDRYGNLRDDLQNLCNYANTGSKVKSLPEKLTIYSLLMFDKLGLSPLSPWHYLTYHKPFVFDSEYVYQALEFRPKYSNEEMFKIAYDWFIKSYDQKKVDQSASAHKSPVKQGILKVAKMFSKLL